MLRESLLVGCSFSTFARILTELVHGLILYLMPVFDANFEKYIMNEPELIHTHDY